MKVYLVGGAVRDKLRGQEPRDKDYVVVGADAQEMIEKGYQKVGQSFEVFLHPKTREEYALSRGKTILDDLKSRDLTINAMAIDENDEIVDPYGGRKDLEQKILRHVSEKFIDDPLRVFRVARFQTYYPDFKIAVETLSLMRKVVKTKVFSETSSERIFHEMKFSLNSTKPSLFFEVLRNVDGLKLFFPELEKLIGVPQVEKYHPEGDCWTHTMLALDYSSKITHDVIIRFCVLVHDLGKGLTPKDILPKHIGHEKRGVDLVKKFCQRLRIPKKWEEASIVVTEFHLKLHRIMEMNPKSIVRMFYEMDAFRKPDLIKILTQACEADEMGKFNEEYSQGKVFGEYFNLVRGVSAKDVKKDLKGKALGCEIRSERVRRLQSLI